VNSEGHSAAHKCCDCIHPTSHSFLTEECSPPATEDNIPWYDIQGDTCLRYTDHLCANDVSVVSRADYSGRDANEMCCECMAPTSPHFLDQDCATNILAWKDAGGYSCADYTFKQWCVNGTIGEAWNAMKWGDVTAYADADGADASQMCCDCMDPSSAGFIAQCTVSEAEVYEWRDKHHVSCEVYTSLNWCDAGSVGAGWESSWGSIIDLADSDGIGAVDACCGCMDEASAVFQSQCAKKNATVSVWYDGDGLTCEDYVTLKYCQGKLMCIDFNITFQVFYLQVRVIILISINPASVTIAL